MRINKHITINRPMVITIRSSFDKPSLYSFSSGCVFVEFVFTSPGATSGDAITIRIPNRGESSKLSRKAVL